MPAICGFSFFGTPLTIRLFVVVVRHLLCTLPDSNHSKSTRRIVRLDHRASCISEFILDEESLYRHIDVLLMGGGMWVEGRFGED